MTACDNVGPLLDGYHDDELDALERRRVEQHLAGCAACSRELASLAAVGRAVRDAVAGVPSPDIWEAVSRELPRARARTSAPPRSRPPCRARWLPATVAAAAVAASVFLLWPGPEGPSGVVRSVYAPEHPVMVLEAEDGDDPTIIWLMNETPEATHVRI
jgi:anti-sigma factor RsiW